MENQQNDNNVRFTLTPMQGRIVAAGLSVVAFSAVIAFVAVVGYFFIRVLAFTAPAVTPVIVAMFLALLLKPYYELLRRYLRSNALTMVVLFATILLPMVGLCWFGGEFLVSQMLHLAKSAPTIVERASDWVQTNHPGWQPMLVQLGAEPDQLTFFTNPKQFSADMISAVSSEYGVAAMKWGFGFVKYLLGMLSWLLVLVFLCVFLASPEVKGADLMEQMPFLKPDTRKFIAEQIDAFVDILVSFFRRQVVICLLEGMMYGIGFTLVGLPYGFVLGFLLGTLNLVPFLGSITCLAMAIPLAYFGDDGSALRLIGVILVWVIGQGLDGYVITPKIQGKSTGLGYAGVIFSFLFWGMVFHSCIGLLMAIPLSAFCLVFWRAVKSRYIRPVI